MSDKPNVTVIYQDAKAPGPTCAQIVAEFLAFILLIVIVGIVGLWK